MSLRARTASGIVAALILLILSVVEPAFAAQRTFVSTTGSDGSATCSLVAPCRGFAKAITVTDPGGEIVVVDSGGYGSVSVNKNVSINSPAGVYAGISVFATFDGITVTAPATKVVLRGLTINGQGGNNGIRVQSGEVHIENVVISNLLQAGILVEGGTTVRLSGVVSRSNDDGLRVVPGSGTVSVLVRDSEFSNNTTAGIGVSPSAAGASALVTVERSSVTRNSYGFVVIPSGSASSTLVVAQAVASENTGAGVYSNGGGATVYVRESAITRNMIGLLQSNSGALNACGMNLLVANGTAQSGVINTPSCLDVAAASGTVTNVATGAGLTGGPITTSGTVNLAATQLMPTVACTSGQVPQWSGSAWTCTAAGGAGTVTSVGTGAGLAGGPVTTSGTVDLRLNAAGGLSKVLGPGSNELGIAAGGVGATQLAGGSVDVSKLNTTSTDARYFMQGGNTFGVLPGSTATLGTADSNALEIYVGNSRVMRYQPTPGSPSVVGGYAGNHILSTAPGQTVAGGGGPGSSCVDVASGTSTRSCANVATGFWGTVSGGESNLASQIFATVAGGAESTAGGVYSTIGGGQQNTASGQYATIAGGLRNMASGDYSFAAGRRAKTQTSDATPTIHHGAFAFADHSAFDFYTAASDEFAVRATGGARFVTAIDGSGNPTTTFNLSANGQAAIPSTVVLNSTNLPMITRGFDPFDNTAPPEKQNLGRWGLFMEPFQLVTGIPALGGREYAVAKYNLDGTRTTLVRVDQAGNLFMDGNGSLNFGATTREMLSLWNSGGVDYGIGVQPSVQYARTHGSFAWFLGGAHNDTGFNPGFGGSVLMTLSANPGPLAAVVGTAYAQIFINTSDRNVKTAFAPIDSRQVLDGVVRMPISSWAYKNDMATRHIGPVAQDFRAAFDVGSDDRTISTVDEGGVALAAIQGLYAEIKGRDATIADQRREIESLRDRMSQVESLRGELAALKDAVASLTAAGTVVAARKN